MCVYRTGSSWLHMVPWGIRYILNWIKNHYGDVPILVTENGCSDRNSSMEDTHRVNYLSAYINNVLKGTCKNTIIHVHIQYNIHVTSRYKARVRRAVVLEASFCVFLKHRSQVCVGMPEVDQPWYFPKYATCLDR